MMFKGVVIYFFGTSGMKCACNLTDITEIDVLSNHIFLRDSTGWGGSSALHHQSENSV